MYFKRRGWWVPVLLSMVFLAGGGRAEAQATFSVSSAASTVIRTGHTELVGDLTFRVSSGMTVAGNIEINLQPAILTNAENGIKLSWSGITPSPTIMASMSHDEGLVSLTVPQGMDTNSAVTISGIRVSVPNSGIETLDARISTTGNRLGARQNTVPVIARVVDAISVDPTSDTVYTYNANRSLVDSLGSLTFQEGFAGTFSDDRNDGRTVNTQVIFQISTLPENTQLRFPEEIESSQTDAALKTMNDVDEGGGVLISGSSSSNQVIYEFSTNGSSSAARVIDVFSFRPTLETTGTPGSGTGFYQMMIGPVGTARPTVGLPSRKVPRYDKLLLPILSPDLPVTKDFLFPVQRGADTQEFAISNTTSGSAPLKLRAFDDAGALLEGPDITNDKIRLLSSHRTLTFNLQEMFGPDATTKTVSAVGITSQNDRTVATTIGRTDGGSFATHLEMPISSAYFPFDRRNPAEIPVLSATNAGGTADATWTLMTSAGVELASVTRPVEAGGSVREPLDALFGVDVNALPLSGYVRLRAPDTRFRGGLLDNPGGPAHAVPGLLATGRSRIVFPYFVAGGVYNTIASLINPSASVVAEVTMTALDSTGTPVASPFTIRIDPGARDDLDFAAILGPGNRILNGYFVLGIEGPNRNPFASVPHLAGMVRVGAEGISAVAPLLNDTGDEFFFTPTRSDDNEYTGFSILNTGSLPLEVTIEAYASNGRLLDTLDILDTEEEEVITIAPETSIIGLLRDLLPDLGTQESGYVRVSATTARLSVAAFRGRMDLSELIFLRRQTAP